MSLLWAQHKVVYSVTQMLELHICTCNKNTENYLFNHCEAHGWRLIFQHVHAASHLLHWKDTLQGTKSHFYHWRSTLERHRRDDHPHTLLPPLSPPVPETRTVRGPGDRGITDLIRAAMCSQRLSDCWRRKSLILFQLQQFFMLEPYILKLFSYLLKSPTISMSISTMQCTHFQWRQGVKKRVWAT